MVDQSPRLTTSSEAGERGTDVLIAKTGGVRACEGNPWHTSRSSGWRKYLSADWTVIGHGQGRAVTIIVKVRMVGRLIPYLDAICR